MRAGLRAYFFGNTGPESKSIQIAVVSDEENPREDKVATSSVQVTRDKAAQLLLKLKEFLKYPRLSRLKTSRCARLGHLLGISSTAGLNYGFTSLVTTAVKGSLAAQNSQVKFFDSPLNGTTITCSQIANVTNIASFYCNISSAILGNGCKELYADMCKMDGKDYGISYAFMGLLTLAATLMTVSYVVTKTTLLDFLNAEDKRLLNEIGVDIDENTTTETLIQRLSERLELLNFAAFNQTSQNSDSNLNDIVVSYCG